MAAAVRGPYPTRDEMMTLPIRELVGRKYFNFTLMDAVNWRYKDERLSLSDVNYIFEYAFEHLDNEYLGEIRELWWLFSAFIEKSSGAYRWAQSETEEPITMKDIGFEWDPRWQYNLCWIVPSAGME